MSHGFLEVMLREVILHGLQEVTSERQVILHDLHVAVTSMVSMVQNGIPYFLLYNKTIQKIVDLCFSRHEVLLNSKLNHIYLHFALVTSTLVNNCIMYLRVYQYTICSCMQKSSI